MFGYCTIVEGCCTLSATVQALKRLGKDLPSHMAFCRLMKLQKLMIYSTAD